MKSLLRRWDGTEDPGRDTLGGVRLHGPGAVTVDLAGDVGAAVGEAVADDEDVDAHQEADRPEPSAMRDSPRSA
jgi:hypothetical protein